MISEPMEEAPEKATISILWFRHGLRLHDNPAFLEAVKDKSHFFLPLFIFDGESAGKYFFLLSHQT